MAGPEQGAKVGLSTAVELALKQAGGIEQARAEQLALLPMARPAPDDAPAAERRRGPGRPAGSHNKRTEAWVEFILARYQSPLVFLAETISRPAAMLSAEIGCTVAEAFDLQRRAAADLAPYLHQRQPLAIQAEGRSLVALSIVDPATLAALAGAGEGEIGGQIIENGGNPPFSEGDRAPVASAPVASE